jgi:hypothetical protein
VLGALRGGGFTNARINSGAAAWDTTTVPGTTYKIVPAASSGSTSTSKHAINSAGTMWGNGAVSATASAGPQITLQCTSCHDPHGNGNYRILRPVASALDAGLNEKAAPWEFSAPASVTTVTFKELLRPENRYKFYYNVVVASPGTFKETQPVTFYGTTGGADLIISGTIESITGNTIVVSGANSAAITGYTYNSGTKAYDPGGTPTAATGGFMGYANPSAIASQTGYTATTSSFKTLAINGLIVGQKVTLAGFTPAAYNGTFNVSAVGTFSNNGSTFQNAFTIDTTANAAVTVVGSISGIPDAKASVDSHAVGGPATAKVYVTANYWMADDHCYNGTANCVNVNMSSTKTAYIANISQWCATCHTRLLAGSGAWGKNSGDGMYTFEHRSQNGAEGSPNCIQCHVAHGSNASMTGDGSTAYSNTVGSAEFGLAAGDSFLLRVDNRGTCNMCHNK